ncbi:MAG: hypothetical protein M3Z09_09910 [Acidobacteriota bacterium]|nr:hypothetical protein [Acidobacteriota bacterium]
MTLTSLGRVNVSTPGTPVRLSTNAGTRVNRLLLQTIPGATGKGYFGLTQMNKTTLAGVSRVLSTGDLYELTAEDGTDSIYLYQLAIDVDVPGEGLLVSYWTE